MLKKFAFFVAAISAMALLSIIALADVSIVVSGRVVAIEEHNRAINIDGRLMLPLNNIFDMLDMPLAMQSWNAREQRAELSFGQTHLVFMSDGYVIKNGVATSPIDGLGLVMHQGRPFVPLRFVAESFDMIVGWSHEHQAVIIAHRQMQEQIIDMIDVEYTRLSFSGRFEQNDIRMDFLSHVDIEEEFMHVIGWQDDEYLEQIRLGDTMFAREAADADFEQATDMLALRPFRLLDFLASDDLEAISAGLGVFVDYDGHTVVSGFIFLERGRSEVFFLYDRDSGQLVELRVRDFYTVGDNNFEVTEFVRIFLNHNVDFVVPDWLL